MDNRNIHMLWIVEKRVWIDDDTYDKLNDLFRKTRGYVKREILCNAILYEWIKNNGNLKIGNIVFDRYSSSRKINCAWLNVDETLWDNFRYLCHRTGLDINTGFRIAIYNFIYIIDDNYQTLLRYFFG